MKGWYRLGLGCAALAAAAMLGWQFGGKREPAYEGRSLSFWLEKQYQEFQREGILISEQEMGRDQTTMAIRGIDTNAIPYLLRLLATEESPWKRWVQGHWPISSRTMAGLGFEQRFTQWAGVGVVGPSKAYFGFRVLGPSAKIAIPELIRILLTTRNFCTRFNTAQILGLIGPPAAQAIPALVENLNDKDQQKLKFLHI